MKITPEEKAELDELLSEYISHDKVQEMKNYIQHGNITTYDHCYKVCEQCFLLNRRKNLGADESILIPAAFLHDFYLYDWHENDRSHKLHGFFHPGKASKNVHKYFSQLTERHHKIIRSHMWPLTITKLPTSKEAWILCLVDKQVSLNETLFYRGDKIYVD